MRVLWCLLIFFVSGPILSQDPVEIIRKAEEKVRGKETSQSQMTITTVRPTWQREMTLKSWSKGDELSLTLITSPAKEKGIAFLKRKREVWNWMPSIERTIKMPPSMMSQSWMGTDLTNDDLVRESSSIKDYTHKSIGDSVVQDRNCWILELIPLPDAPVVWGKVVIFIDKVDYIQMITRFYDEDQFLVNTMVVDEIKMLAGMMLASRLEVIPADKEGHKTVLQFDRIAFDNPIPDRFFTTQNMKRVK